MDENNNYLMAGAIIFLGFLSVGSRSLLLNKSFEKPNIQKCADMTGDGLEDIIIDVKSAGEKTGKKYLFVKQTDGTYVRTEERKQEGSKLNYFVSDTGIGYFFDGEIYRKAVQQK